MTFLFLLSGLTATGFLACKQEQAKTVTSPNTDQTVPELQALNQAVEQGGGADAYFERAQYYYQQNVFDLAEQDLLRALSYDSTRPEILHLLADTYMDNFQSRKALKTMEKVATLHPERIPSLLKLSEFQLILKQYEDALKTIEKIIAIDPESSEGFFMSGMVFREMGDSDRAINAFQRSTELDPENVDAWIILGNLFDQKKNPIAARYFDNAVRVAPDNPYALHAKAYYLQNHGQPQEAIRMYKEINKNNPDYTDAYLNTGILYLTQDSLGKAWEHFNIAVNTSPTDPRGYYFRGLIYEQQAKYDDAIRDYEQALVFDPNYAEAKEALSLLQAQR